MTDSDDPTQALTQTSSSDSDIRLRFRHQTSDSDSDIRLRFIHQAPIQSSGPDSAIRFRIRHQAPIPAQNQTASPSPPTCECRAKQSNRSKPDTHSSSFAEREGFEPFEQRWTNLQAGRDLAHQRLEITLEVIRLALSVSARESTLVEWSRADFGQWMGSDRTWPRPARCRELCCVGPEARPSFLAPSRSCRVLGTVCAGDCQWFGVKGRFRVLDLSRH